MQPSTFLNYPGKVDCIGQIMGPNMLGEYLTVVSCEFDGENTRVGLAYGIHDLDSDEVVW